MAALYARNKIKTVRYDCDIKLLFETYLNIVYKKASHKLHALARVSNHISQRKLGSIWLLLVWNRYSTAENQITKLIILMKRH